MCSSDLSARMVNERLAEIVAAHPDRFVALGTLPMQAPELAVRELDHVIGKLGFRGIEIGTNIAGAELSERRFDRVWARAEELGIVVFMHPHGHTEGRRLVDHYFNNVIGNPLDTTVAVSHLIFGGVLDRHPKLKIVSAHGGGYLAHYPARMDHAHAARPDCCVNIRKRPTSYLKKLYFDTIVFDHRQLEHLVNLWGADHIVLGTDYPYDMGYYRPVQFIEGAKKLTAAQKDAIAGLNAAKLLAIRPPRVAKKR